MPTPLTISLCRQALLPTEASLADGAESVLLQLRWIDTIDSMRPSGDDNGPPHLLAPQNRMK
jgi:hypothetical protein